MFKPRQRAARRRAPRGRRWEVERCLAESGLAFGAGRSSPSVRGWDEERVVYRLRGVLEDLGPVFQLLGLYLSCRADLFSTRVRKALAAIPDGAEPTPPASMYELLGRELGREPGTLFSEITAHPHESRLLHQSHRARLQSGESVTVKIVHPEVEEYLDGDPELLPLCDPVLLCLMDREDRTQSCVEVAGARADFQDRLEAETDLLRQAESLGACGDSGDVPQGVGLHLGLSTSRVLIWEGPEGRGLAEMLADGDLSPESLENVGSSLCLTWLRQVLEGQRIPADPRPENVLVQPSGHVVFTGGLILFQPSPKWRQNLWRYLAGAAAHDPNQACTALLKEMTAPPDPMNEIDEDELQRQFRQIMPLRDGAQGNHWAEYLLLQWRRAVEDGYRPRAALLGFYRGLAQIEAVASRLAPERDLLQEVFDELRLERDLESLRHTLDLDVKQYATLLAELPRKLETVLTLAASGGLRVKLQLEETHLRGQPSERFRAGMALVVVLVAVVLMARHFASLPVVGRWSEGIGAVALVVLGGLLLGVLRRGR